MLDMYPCNLPNISPIYNKGQVGQTVIYGFRVNSERFPDTEKFPILQYPVPSIFTIVEKHDGEDGYYILSDAKGNHIKVADEEVGAYVSFLHDAQEWLNYIDKNETTRISSLKKEINRLEDRLELLKEILIKQGIRTVTKEQAAKLGLK